jgi:ABC-type uncharacterized transport system substrate-binding protein
MPAIYQYRPFAAAGGLVSYGTDETEYYRLVGQYAGRILKGEKPFDLPVQQSTKVELFLPWFSEITRNQGWQLHEWNLNGGSEISS